jgi:hypothetical protein
MIRLLALKSFLRPQAIFPMPAGIVADGVAEWGQFGFLQNANTYASALASTTTGASNVNITAAQVQQGVIQLNAGASGSFTATLPSTASIMAQLGNTIPMDGSYSKHLYIKNNLTGQPGTLVAGDANTTIVDGAIFGSNVTRCYIMRVLNSSNLTLTNIGQIPL